jgi:integrase
MAENAGLIETSFADAIEIIAASPELPEQTRRHWATSLRQIAKALDRPLEVIPARYSAVRADLLNLHEVPAGLTAKTLQNHKSNVKAALLWLTREKGIPEHGAPLSPEWTALKDEIADPQDRWRLSSFWRYCSANNIKPSEVDEEEETVERFLAYRTLCGKPADAAFRRLMARAWNGNVGKIAGWPTTRLFEPPVKSAVEVPWFEFADGLQHGADAYLAGLTKIRKSRTGQRIRPLKALTIRARRAELQAAARMAVRVGVPIKQLDSLAALLSPGVAEKVLNAYCDQNGGNPTVYAVNLAGRFLAIAQETKCLDEADCEQLKEMWSALEDDRPEGFTPKNTELIRHVLTPEVWDRIINLPFALMKAAWQQRDHKPVQSAVTAQIAVAIAILTINPVRIKNLTEIRLGLNLNKPGGPQSQYWLHFPNYDVKNRIKLEAPLEDHITPLIDKYVHEFRPALLRGRDEDVLFPGLRAGTKGKITFGTQLADRILKHTGLRITAHQFRHAAAALILQKHSGNYELVRLILGHRNVQTTIKCYIGLKEIQATRIYGDLIRDRLNINLDAAE